MDTPCNKLLAWMIFIKLRVIFLTQIDAGRSYNGRRDSFGGIQNTDIGTEMRFSDQKVVCKLAKFYPPINASQIDTDRKPTIWKLCTKWRKKK